MPKIVHFTETDYFIECEYIPFENAREKAAEVAAQINQMYCFKCGYHKDFEQLPKIVNGKEVHLYCLNPHNPYLLELKKRIEASKKAQETLGH